ncbi:hypothetical protein FD11_GL000650 [Ligilactobacillus pobuzihii E100301 = KCTC 13174]|uniref:Uncharacterized protein n=1 Tax=Ligilactobacillus pobuzihii TaxID=449659 RepID=A0A0R2L4C2_9LACO|nr:hypothetical protein FD11_GL000650 [Ligilactobacillus pobuzihii E100301 = KCTC 13174]KRN96526.1 hypothetical protein IV66_GL000712 [Ligilactobacillus pobuzihii]GEN48809.1 hypothetical protein LPO01_16010 [Ligilactobacillus pobuzihii]
MKIIVARYNYLLRKAVTGSKSVTLIDGRRITDLVEKYKIHITPISSFTLDDYYFEKK